MSGVLGAERVDGGPCDRGEAAAEVARRGDGAVCGEDGDRERRGGMTLQLPDGVRVERFARIGGEQLPDRLAEAEGLAVGGVVDRWRRIHHSRIDEPASQRLRGRDTFDRRRPAFGDGRHEVEGEIARDELESHVTILTGDATWSNVWRMSERRAGVIAYLTSAVTARSADAGAIVAAVLAGTAVGGPAAGGLLAAALTIPHLIGPLAGRLLDARERPGPVLAGAFLWYAALLVVAAVTLPVSIVGAAAALAAAGCAGPLVTGGLSSRLASILAARATAEESAADAASVTQRRGQALDALTYGVAGTVGPAAVAACAVLLSPAGALAATAGLLVIAAVPVLWLPSTRQTATRAAGGGILRVLLTSAPLRRTTVATVGSATALAAAPVIAAALASSRGAAPSSAALLMALYGAGGLAAALLLIARPLSGSPERLVRIGVAVTGVAVLLPLAALLAPSAETAIGGVAFALVGASNSALFAATLAARTEYSPPGAAARVFATVAGVKVAGSAIGVAAAGLIAPFGAGVLILCAAGVCALTLTAVALDAAIASRPSRAARSSRTSLAP